MINYFLGKTVTTKEIHSTISKNKKFANEITNCLQKYITCDWGQISQEDKEMNNNAVKTDDGRIFAAYDTSEGKVYIVTEHDRSATTILFAHGYW